jgi:hypothetical protein
MSKYIEGTNMLTNLFPILNASQLNYTYRLWEVSGLSPDDEEFEQNRVSLRLKISRDIKGPAETTVKNGNVFVAIPTGYPEPSVRYDLSPSVAKLKQISDSVELNLALPGTENQYLAKRFLQSAIFDNLRKNNELWQPKAGRPFFFKRPINNETRNRTVDVFEGFAIRVTYVKEVGYCLLIDCKTHYTSTKPWPGIIPFDERWNYLRQSASPKKQNSTHCVYKFGGQWYEIIVQTILNATIKETEFVHPDTNLPISVYDYSSERWGDKLPEWFKSLKHEHTAITYVTWPDGPKRHGAASLCYPVVKTADLYNQGQGDLHKIAIIPPQQRLNDITGFVQRFVSGVEIGGQGIEIANEPYSVYKQIFSIPVLKFGNEKLLDIENNDIPIGDYPRERLKLLRDPQAGFWDKRSLQQQWVIASKEIQNTIWPDFKSNLSAQLSEFYDQSYKYEPTEIWYEDFGDELFRQIASIQKAIRHFSKITEQQPSGYCLVILPAQASHELPAYLTSKYSQNRPALHIACIHQNSLSSFYVYDKANASWLLNKNNNVQKKFKGYVRNVAIKLLLLNSRWPFVLTQRESQNPTRLEKRMQSTLFIGFDVLNAVAGFTFLGKNGEICIFKSLDSEEKENIPGRKVREVILEHTKEIINAYKWNPDRIVLIRDGKLFERELKGFKQAVDLLNINNAVAVEVPKYSTLNLRFFVKTRGEIRNPNLGQWYTLDENEISICTTGWPFKTPGTSLPLTIRRKWGSESIKDIGQDIFNLAQLAWTAPDLSARYPLPIRYTDMRLQLIASEYDEEETVYGDDVRGDNSPKDDLDE